MTTHPTEQATGDPTGEPAEPSEWLDADERFHLLQNERRRLVLRYLRDATADSAEGSNADGDVDADGEDGRVWMRDVAEQVAAWENDTTVARLSSTQRQRVYIPLYQNHLPKLDDAGVIDYNQSRGIVEPTDHVDRLAAFLDDGESGDADAGADASESDAAADTAWNGYYLGASGVGAALLGGATLSVLPGFLVAAGILALFSTLSLSQFASGVSVGSDTADEEGA